MPSPIDKQVSPIKEKVPNFLPQDLKESKEAGEEEETSSIKTSLKSSELDSFTSFTLQTVESDHFKNETFRRDKAR